MNEHIYNQLLKRFEELETENKKLKEQLIQLEAGNYCKILDGYRPKEINNDKSDT